MVTDSSFSYLTVQLISGFAEACSSSILAIALHIDDVDNPKFEKCVRDSIVSGPARLGHDWLMIAEVGCR